MRTLKEIFQEILSKRLTTVSGCLTIIYITTEYAKEALMFQTTTIIVGNNAGAKFSGAGSLRMARAAAKGRKAVIKYVNNGATTFSVWNPDGFIVATY